MRRAAWFVPLLAAAIVGAGTVAQPAAPRVFKVEPPGWWAAHTVNPVRLLVRGANLSGARAESARPDVRVGPVVVNARGTYAFLDVTIDRAASPGGAPVRLVTPAGPVSVPFEITPPLPRRGRYQGFNEDDAIYLLMPDRFANGDPANDRPPRSAALLDRSKSRFYHGGDLQGVIDRLPYLRDLGVTTIWLNPVYDNADRADPERRYDGEPFADYHGYGAVDFYAVDERLGDMATMRRLVDAAHAAGMKIMLDQVANHTGPFHPWVDDPPTATWFNGTRATHLANSFDAPLLLDPRASAALRRQVLEGWFADILPDLNQDDPEVAAYLIQNSIWWVSATGLDAVRQDTVPYVPSTFWRDWTAALVREFPSIRIVGEVLDPTPVFVASYQKGRRDRGAVDAGMHSLFDYPLFFALRRAFARGGSLKDVTQVLAQDAVYPDADRLVTLIGSHDVRRFMGEPQASPESLKLAATVLLTMRGIPQWYYGDEIALAGGDDPDNRRDFPGGWRDDPRNAFDASGRTAVEQDVFSHVRALLHLRRAHAPLRRGTLAHLALSDNLYVFARTIEGVSIVVAVNSGATAARLDMPVDGSLLREGVRVEDALGGGGAFTVANGRAVFTLAPRRSAVFVPRQSLPSAR